MKFISWYFEKARDTILLVLVNLYGYWSSVTFIKGRVWDNWNIKYEIKSSKLKSTNRKQTAEWAVGSFLYMYIFFSVLLYLCPVDVAVVAAEVLVKQINLYKLVRNLCRKSPDLFHRFFCTSRFLICSCRFLLRIYIWINALFPEWCFIVFKHVVFLQSTFYIWKTHTDICTFASWCDVHKHLLAPHEHAQGCVGLVTISAWRHDH